MIRKLRIKFICINMLIVTGMLCVILGMTYHFTAQNLRDESVRMLQRLAASSFRPGIPNERPEEVRLPYFTVEISRWGALVSASGGYYDLSDEAFLWEVVNAANRSQTDTGVLREYNLRFCRVLTPDGIRYVFADTSSEENTLQNLVRSCAAIGGASFLVFLLISVLLARWAVKPVETAWNRQRQFIADASHELKTPLTVILTNAELLQGARDEESRAQFTGNILTMSRQMRGLVESLLELARVDSGAVKAETAAVNLSELVSDAALPFEPLYFEKGLKLEYRLEEGLWTKGSAARLRQVVEILLDNAMKYAAPGAEVAVSLKRRGLRVRLAVANQGEAIPERELKNIFKRFYRADKVRSMNQSYGLGLSIAQSIVREHRGKIWAESAEGVNTFFVELALAPGA